MFRYEQDHHDASKAVVDNKDMSVPLEVPNKATLEAFQEVEDISNGKKKTKKYSNVSELRKDLKA